MITKELEATKKCCLYASDFHLEMILVPYIKKRFDKTKFVILTENNLEDTIKTLLNRINIDKSDKDKILDLKWYSNDNEKLDKIKELNEKNNKICIIINGNYNYIKEKNKKLNELMKDNLEIIDCFNISDSETNIEEIQYKYKEFINTSTLN